MDLTSQATMQLGQTLAQMRALRGEINANTEALKRYNDIARRTQSNEMKNLGRAVKDGGPLGSFSDKIIKGGDMGGVFGRIAVAITAASMALRVYNAVVDANLERVRMVIQAQREMQKVTEDTRKAIDGMARKGEAQLPGFTKLAAAGGQAAIDDAEMVSSTGTATNDQANRGVAAIYNRFGNTKRSRNGVDIAMRGAMGGLDFEEVAQELTKYNASIDRPEVADRMLGQMLQRQTNRVGNPATLWQERMRNVDASGFIGRAREQAGERSVVAAAERDALMRTAPGQADAAEAKSPGTKILLETYKVQQEQLAAQQKIADAQPAIAAALANLGMLLGGEGSETQKLLRMRNAQAEGAGIPVDRSSGTSTPRPPNYMNMYGGMTPGIAPFGR